jgi:predicted murein hydrolase (TIGR00659 family)
MIDLAKLTALQGPIVWLPCTIILYAGCSAIYQRLNKLPVANPTLLTIAGMSLVLLCTGTPYKLYFDSVAVLHFLLGTAVVALALPLYRNISRLQGRGLRMAVALVAGSAASIFVGLIVAILAHASVSTILSLAPKSATAAVSMEISRIIGGVPALTATLTILTGIIGAVGGPYVLDAAQIQAPESRGFAMGVASHGIGTARAFTEGEIAGSFSGLGMALNAVLTALIVPSAVKVFGFG